jgi:hypothetical protein
MKICILGDSFSSDSGPGSWIYLLAQHHEIENFSLRGASQYRLWKVLQQNLQSFRGADLVIFFHTNPDRVFVPDHVPYPTRELQSHARCDMVANDALNSSWRATAECYYRFFFDPDQQQVFQTLLIDSMVNSIDVAVQLSGFNLDHDAITSIRDVHLAHRGDINHMDEIGNTITFDIVSNLVKDAA